MFKKFAAIAATGALLLSVAAPLAMANDDMGGLDLNSYCASTGRDANAHVKPGTQNWYCTVANNDSSNHIQIGEACEWQYAKDKTGKNEYPSVSREAAPGNPYTYNCYF